MRKFKDFIITKDRETNFPKFGLIEGFTTLNNYKPFRRSGLKKGSEGLCYDLVNYFRFLDPDIPHDTKKCFEYLYENYGHKMWERWNKMLYKEWIVPIMPVKNTLLRGYKGKYIQSYVRMAYENRYLMEEVLNDGLDNILPLTLATGKNPKDLKKIVGKGVWKKICRNTKTRNLLITKVVFRYKNFLDVDLLKRLIDQPSTLLKRGIILPNIKGIEDWAKECGYKNISQRDIDRLNNIKYDCSDMCSQVGEQFNPNWSLSRMYKEHERLKGLILAKEYSKDIFPIISRNKDFYKREFSHGSYIAKIIDSPYELKMEGEMMQHCIGSYSSTVAKGDYVMYSIRDSKDRRKSSLQIILEDGSIGQHYGKGNSFINDKKLLDLAKTISNYYKEAIKNENK